MNVSACLLVYTLWFYGWAIKSDNQQTNKIDHDFTAEFYCQLNFIKTCSLVPSISYWLPNITNPATVIFNVIDFSRSYLLYFSVFYLWNAGLITEFSKTVMRFWGVPPPPMAPPLKCIWRFFAKLVLPRKQSFYLTVVFFPKNAKHSSKTFNFFWNSDVFMDEKHRWYLWYI